MLVLTRSGQLWLYVLEFREGVSNDDLLLPSRLCCVSHPVMGLCKQRRTGSISVSEYVDSLFFEPPSGTVCPSCLSYRATVTARRVLGDMEPLLHLKARRPPISTSIPSILSWYKTLGTTAARSAPERSERETKKHLPESSIPEAPGKTTRESVSDAIDGFSYCVASFEYYFPFFFSFFFLFHATYLAYLTT